MPTTDIEQLPLARLEYRRSKNPLATQPHRWALVVVQNDEVVAHHEQYRNKADCLEQALKSTGFQPLTFDGAAALEFGATFSPTVDGSIFPDLATVHGHNTHYRITLVGWPKAWVRKSARG